MKRAAHAWINRVWYGDSGWYRLLLPLSALYWVIINLRAMLYRTGVLRTARVAVPVIVVGNITAGGTGKTPTVVWLARELDQRGFRPGVVSRGYGGSHSGTSMRVDRESDPRVVGDEPVLIAQRAGCPVVVDANRGRAVSMLVDDGADIIIADDGLQHYALERDYEMCVIDGARGLGNRLLLPAGPLRETLSRLEQVDQVLVNGKLKSRDEPMSVVEQNAIEFQLVAREVCRVNGSLSRPIERFADTTVHGVAAIGNPARFFDLLRGHGMQVIEHEFPDHAALDPKALRFKDDFNVLMTEKDAVKLGRELSDRYWYVPVELEMEPVDAQPWLEQIESRMKGEQAA